MKNYTLFTYCAFIGLLVTACSPASVPLVAEKPLYDQRVLLPESETSSKQTFDWITEDGGQSQLDFNPQVDILFVTDNSDSMRSAQENLARNIDRFTAGITKNKVIDYHIGVISVWDSISDSSKKKDPYQIGELRKVKNELGKTSDIRFITKANRQHTASTLKIGILPLNEGGPEFEEIFSPLSAALEKTGRGDTNEEFFRPEARLVVVLLTDADDASKSITSDQMAEKLIAFKNGNAKSVSVYGVIVRPNDPDDSKDWNLRIHPKYHPECFTLDAKNILKNNGTCSGFGPEKLEKFIITANRNVGTPDEIREKHIISIVSPKFGQELGKIGDDITAKTLAKEIFLSQRPRLDEKGQLMVRVRYGNQVVPHKAKGGWLYNPEHNSVRLSGDIEYQYTEGARFSVDLVPLALRK